MPTDTQRLIKNKDFIVSTLENKGPSLPVHIARSVNLSTLFASAFLSELYGEKRILMSHLKVGSSSLYYLPGQEGQLENFIQYLNPKEKEAFSLLKKEKILKDELQEPAIRVALRQIKDFAHPINTAINGETYVFWKYFLLSDQETDKMIEQLVFPRKELNSPPLLPTQNKENDSNEDVQTKKEKVPRKPRAIIPTKIVSIQLPFSSQSIEQPVYSPFAQIVKDHLQKKDITLHQIISDNKKEVLAKISIKTPYGLQAFYLIAKDKKRIKEEELIEALQKAHSEKLPAFIIAPGDVEKKAHPLLQEWGALLKFERL
ncbi:hypothetical protein FJZ18_03100 [Candidatus Pacearchaeota archaeon]|nr:hypothetical protein [Candidatus Pacearchaeota archaeon]